MEFDKYLTKIAKREFLKEGRLWNFLTCQVNGYIFRDDSIEVYLDNGKSKELANLPHSMEYFQKCHRYGYHIDHWSSKRKVKKPVHTIHMTNYSDIKTTLTVRTINEHVYKQLHVQFDALGFIPDRTIRYEGKSITLDSSITGMGITTKMETFKNIIEYSQFKDEVTVTTAER